MNAPTSRALTEWLRQFPQSDAYTCSDCGLAGPGWKVQPQHPYYADGQIGIFRCSDCIGAIQRRMRVERKAQLAAMDRCEVDGCRMRGMWTVAGGVLMCGRHLAAVQREHARRMSGFGGAGLFMPANYGRDGVLKLAKGLTIER